VRKRRLQDKLQFEQERRDAAKTLLAEQRGRAAAELCAINTQKSSAEIVARIYGDGVSSVNHILDAFASTRDPYQAAVLGQSLADVSKFPNRTQLKQAIHALMDMLNQQLKSPLLEQTTPKLTELQWDENWRQSFLEQLGQKTPAQSHKSIELPLFPPAISAIEQALTALTQKMNRLGEKEGADDPLVEEVKRQQQREPIAEALRLSTTERPKTLLMERYRDSEAEIRAKSTQKLLDDLVVTTDPLQAAMFGRSLAEVSKIPGRSQLNQAIHVLMDVLDQQPAPSVSRMALVEALTALTPKINQLGEKEVAAGHLGEACQVFSENLEVLKRLASMDPSNSDLQRNITAALSKLGDLKRDTTSAC
jgi:hypothetical protein